MYFISSSSHLICTSLYDKPTHEINQLIKLDVDSEPRAQGLELGAYEILFVYPHVDFIAFAVFDHDVDCGGWIPRVIINIGVTREIE